MRAILAALLLSIPFNAAAQPAVRSLQLWDCDDVTGYPTLERETANIKQGDGALRWRRHPERRRFDVPDLPRDWSGYNRLRFWLHSASPLPTRITLIIRSENPVSDGIDYWAYEIPIDYSGWREIDLEIGLGGGTRFPLGWHSVDALTFTAAGYGADPHPEADLIVDDIRIVSVVEKPGPSLSDAEFFAGLDLSRPDLSALRAAVAAGDMEAAKTAFLAHLRERKSPVWHFSWTDRPPPPPAQGSSGFDYYRGEFTVDWTGWKTIELSIADFARTREPIGWGWISALYFSATFGGNEPSRETVLVFDEFDLVGGDTPSFGGFETEAERSRWRGYDPEMNIIDRGSLAARFTPSARKGHFRCVSPPRDWSAARALRFRVHSAAATGDRITLMVASDLAGTGKADKILAREIDGRRLPAGAIDWHDTPLERGDPDFSTQWTSRLNRHFHWRDLGEAYWSSGDEKYAREWIAQMRDWIEKNPRVHGAYGNNSLTWATINAGLRAGDTWPDALYRFLGSPSLTPDDAVTFMKSWVDHGRHLLRITVEKPDHKGNWVTMECNGLGHLALLFPEWRESARWLEAATTRLRAEMARQVYPDGAQKELAPGYHLVAYDNFLALHSLAALNGGGLPANYIAGLESMLDYGLGIMRPDGRLPPVNDSREVRMRPHLERGAVLFDRADFLWAASRGIEGERPAFASIAFPWAGHYVMRSGWGARDAWSLFEAGPYGIGHQHEDKLNLLLHAGGRPLLVEGGIAGYDSSPYRKYALSGWAHNTVIVDGAGQRRRGLTASYATDVELGNLWIASAQFDAAAGVYDAGYGRNREIKARHERAVFFLREAGYWIVIDRLSADEPHEYRTLWHLDAESAQFDTDTLAAWGRGTSDQQLLVTPAATPDLELQIVRGRMEPMLGFAPVMEKRPIPVLDYSVRATRRLTMAWALTPFRGERPEVEISLDEQLNAIHVRVSHAGGVDDLYYAKGRELHLGVAGARLGGRVALVRRAPDGTLLTATAH